MWVFIIIYFVIVLSILLGLIYFLYTITNRKSQSPTEFVGLLSILSSQIKTELDAYENNIFENKGSITNNNFDRYYKDLTMRIIQNISDEMINELRYYYTEDAIYKYIGRSVRDYLVSKIKGTL